MRPSLMFFTIGRLLPDKRQYLEKHTAVDGRWRSTDEYRLNGKNVYMQARTTDETELFIFQNDLESSDFYQEVQVDNITRTDLGEYVANIKLRVRRCGK